MNPWWKEKIFFRNIAFFVLQQDCPNGRLTPAKFVDMYKMFFPSGNAEEFCDHVFRTFDMDKNGYIDFKVRFFRIDFYRTISRMNDMYDTMYIRTHIYIFIYICVSFVNTRKRAYKE